MKNQVNLRIKSNRVFAITPTSFLLKKGASAFRVLKIALGIVILGTLICGSIGCNKTDNVEPEITDEMIQEWIEDLNKYVRVEDFEYSESRKGILSAGDQAVDLLMKNINDPTMGRHSRKWSAYLLGAVGIDRFDEVLEFLLILAEDDEYIGMYAMGGLIQLFEQQDEQTTIDYITIKDNPELGREAAIESLTCKIIRTSEISEVIITSLQEIVFDSNESDQIRLVSVQYFTYCAYPEYESFFVKALLFDSFWKIKESIAYALGDIGSVNAIEPLGNYGLAYKNVINSKFVRQSSAFALGEIGSRLGGSDAATARQFLMNALETEENKGVIDAINEAIAKIDGGKKSGAAQTELNSLEEDLQLV